MVERIDNVIETDGALVLGAGIAGLFTALRLAPFPALVARGGWDAVPPLAHEIGGRAFIAVCDLLVRELGAEEAVFPGAAHQPQLLGEPFNRRVAAFWHAADRR